MISVVMAMGRLARLHPIDAAHVFVARIEALHGIQNARGAGLHGKVDVIAEALIPLDGIDDGLDEIARMGGGEADALDARNFTYAGQKGREIPTGRGGIAIAVHVLAEQLDFGVAGGGEACCLFHDVGAGAASFRTAGERDDAIGAAFITAFDDGEEGAMRVVPACIGSFKCFVPVKRETGDAIVAGFELHQHFRQAGVAGRAGDQADVRRLGKDLLPLLLGDAAQDGNGFPFRVALECIEAVKDFLFGFIANAAGVVEKVSRFVRRFDLGKTFAKKRSDHLFRIVGVHLTAERLHVESLRRHFTHCRME